MRVLVINAGSSSLKYQLMETTDQSILAKGLCERIGIDGRIVHKPTGKPDVVIDLPLPDHTAAINTTIQKLTDPDVGVVASMDEIQAVGHRVVHGGEKFNQSVIVTDEIIDAIEECVALAPIHNPPNLLGIRACQKILPGVPQVAVFDTAFHQTLPEKAFLYALPYDYYTRLGVRRYGFHGTSHSYVAKRAAVLLGKPLESLKIITCHMGNGSSVTAVNGGKSADTSMGFTPLEGVSMGTRSGSVDPAILEYVMHKEALNIEEMTTILNKRAGMLGLSGVSSDFRDLHAAAAKGDKKAQNALDVFAYQVKKTIGGYAAALGGCDALVFTAGIGENNDLMREWIADGLGYMGLWLDKAKNKGFRAEGIISSDSSPNAILVVPTNEELVIAEDTARLTNR